MSRQSYTVSQDGTVYALDLSKNVAVIPLNSTYKNNVTKNTVYADKQIASVQVYGYDDKWASDCNYTRVGFMKAKLIDEVVKQIDKFNDDFILGISYTLYNANGMKVRSAETLVKAYPSAAIIPEDINQVNSEEYRKGLVLDAVLSVPVKPTYAYGIKVKTPDHPYTLVINSIKALTTIGEYKFNIEGETQMECNDLHYASHCHFHIHNPEHMPCCTNNVASPFVTNAKYGTTLIDSKITPAELYIPPEYTSVEIAEVDFNKGTSTFNEITIESPLKEIVITMEMLIDNIVSVYDNAEIDQIIIDNNTPDPDPEPDPQPDPEPDPEQDPDPDPEENPDQNPDQNNNQSEQNTQTETNTEETNNTQTENNSTEQNTQTETNNSTETNTETNNTTEPVVENPTENTSTDQNSNTETQDPVVENP